MGRQLTQPPVRLPFHSPSYSKFCLFVPHRDTRAGQHPVSLLQRAHTHTRTRGRLNVSLGKRFEFAKKNNEYTLTHSLTHTRDPNLNALCCQQAAGETE